MSWLVHFVIGVVLVEAVMLAAMPARRLLLVALAPHLLAGLALLFALRSAIREEPWPVCAVWLGVAGGAHAIAVWRAARRIESTRKRE